MEKFEDEDKMLLKYELNMKFMQEWKEVTRFPDFLSSDAAQEDYRVHSSVHNQYMLLVLVVL